MHELNAAAERLLSTIEGVHCGAEVQPGKVIRTADVIKMCEAVREWHDTELASSPAALESLGFVTTYRKSGDWAATRQADKSVITVYSSGSWYLDIGHSYVSLPLMPTMGQLRALLFALAREEA